MKRPVTGGQAASQSVASIRASKGELRRWARAVRLQVLAENRAALDATVCEAIRTSPSFRKARTVASYLATASEIDLAALVEGSDKRFVVPRTNEEPGPHLTLHPLDEATLELHPFGMLEPSAASPVVPLSEVDLVLVPGLAFDWGGVRLGYGRGYYDRLLAGGGSGPVTMGVTLECLLVEQLPHHAHDVRVQEIVTERGWRPLQASSEPEPGSVSSPEFG